MARPKANRPDEVPAVKDVYWTAFCRPLCAFLLGGDRAWPAVRDWGRKKKINGYFLRNALAWLEEKQYAETYLPQEIKSAPGAWVWRSVNVDNAEAYANGFENHEENIPSQTR